MTNNPDHEPTQFGPTAEDIAGYQEILTITERGGDVGGPRMLGFNPRVNAEVAAGRIDQRSLGTFINPEEATDDSGLNDSSRLKLAQQRYSAAVLGLRVGETVIDERNNSASVPVRLPELDELPPLPQRQSDGKFISADGAVMSQVQADAIHASYYLVRHQATFSQPGSFEKFFRGLVARAEDEGQLVVHEAKTGGDPMGACSMVRQTAKILGYQVGGFTKDPDDGSYVLKIDGIRPGFRPTDATFR